MSSGVLELLQVGPDMSVHAAVHFGEKFLLGVVVLDVVVDALGARCIFVGLGDERLTKTRWFDTSVDRDVGSIDSDS